MTKSIIKILASRVSLSEMQVQLLQAEASVFVTDGGKLVQVLAKGTLSNDEDGVALVLERIAGGPGRAVSSESAG